MERTEGIEPSSVAWKATALPLCYARILHMLLPLTAKATFCKFEDKNFNHPPKKGRLLLFAS